MLLAVVLGYVGLTLAVTDLHRYLAYDEAIYLSQVYPGPALPFTAPRARGLPLLLVPLGWFDAPIPVIRGYLLTVEAGLMYLGFNAWLPVLRGRAVITAAVFGVGWLPLFYGTEVFPNLPVAFGVLAAAGYLARYLTGTSGRPALLGCAVAVALVASVRPTEAAFVTVGVCIVGVTRSRRELALRWGLPVVGLVLGCLPWLIEGALRFGGPLSRIRAASSNVGGGFHPANLRQQLSFTDGPVAGSLRDRIPWPGTLWWLLIGVAVVVLVVRVLIGRADREQRAGATAAVVGVATASPYLFLIRVQEARFLLPAYAVLAVAEVAAVPSPAGIRRSARRWAGLQAQPQVEGRAEPQTELPAVPQAEQAELPAGRRPGWLGSALLVVALSVAVAAFAGWQISAARRVQTDQVAARKLAQTLVDVVRAQGPPPCVVAGEVAFPVIAFGARCRGAPFRPDSPDITVEVGSDRAAMPRVYVLTSTDPARTGVNAVPGSVRPLAADGIPHWWLFIASPDEVVAAS